MYSLINSTDRSGAGEVAVWLLPDARTSESVENIALLSVEPSVGGDLSACEAKDPPDREDDTDDERERSQRQCEGADDATRA